MPASSKPEIVVRGAKHLQRKDCVRRQTSYTGALLKALLRQLAVIFGLMRRTGIAYNCGRFSAKELFAKASMACCTLSPNAAQSSKAMTVFTTLAFLTHASRQPVCPGALKGAALQSEVAGRGRSDVRTTLMPTNACALQLLFFTKALPRILRWRSVSIMFCEVCFDSRMT